MHEVQIGGNVLTPRSGLKKLEDHVQLSRPVLDNIVPCGHACCNIPPLNTEADCK